MIRGLGRGLSARGGDTGWKALGRVSTSITESASGTGYLLAGPPGLEEGKGLGALGFSCVDAAAGLEEAGFSGKGL